MSKGAIDLVVKQEALNQIKKLNDELAEAEARIIKISKNAIGSKGDFSAVNSKKKLNYELKKQSNLLTRIAKDNKKYSDTLNKTVKSQNTFNKKIKDGSKAVSKSQSRFVSFFKTLILFDVARRGVEAFWGAFKQGFETVKSLQSLNLQFKILVGTATAISTIQNQLSSSAKNLGVNILDVSKSFLLFRKSAELSGLSLRDTLKVFKSVTKAASVLGKTDAEIRNVQVALEQMLSKGTVQSEELKKQLGNVLPGAFQIMAEAVFKLNPGMEKTNKAFIKLLETGQIISADVLPEFARQLEKAYGIENVKRIDTIAAATGRLSNYFTEFIATLDKSFNLSGKFSYSIDSLGKNLKNIISTLIILVNTFIAYVVIVKSAIIANNLYTRSAAVARLSSIKFTKALKSLIKIMGLQGLAKTAGLGAASIVALGAAFVATSAGLLIYQVNIGRTLDMEKKLNKAKEDGIDTGNDVIDSLDKEIRKRIELIKIKKAHDLINKSEIESIDIERESIKSIISIYDERKEELKKTIFFLAELQQEYARNNYSVKENGREVEILSPKYVSLGIQLEILTGKYNDLTTEQLKSKDALSKIGVILAGSVDYYEALITANTKLIKSTTDGEIRDTLIEQNKLHQKQIDLMLHKNKIKGKDRPIASIIESTKIAGDEDFTGTEEDLKGITTLYNEYIKRLDIAIAMESDETAIGVLEKTKKALKDKVSQIQSGNQIQLAGSNDILEAMEKELQAIETRNEAEKQAALDRLEITLMTLDAISELAQISSDIISNLTDGRIIKLEEEQDALQRKYDLQRELIEAEVSDEESKAERLRQIEKEKEINDAKIQKKIAKEKEKQFKVDQAAAIFTIGLQTAIGMITAIAQNPPPSPIGVASAILIGIMGTAQTIAVASQPVPKFKHGHLAGTHEGVAMINDGGVAEVIQRRDGSLEMSSQRDKLINMSKGDKVHKSFDSFIDQIPKDSMMDKLQQASIMASLEISKNAMSGVRAEKQFNDSFRDSFRKDIISSLKGISIHNHSESVGQAVKEALADYDFTQKML